jgi:methylenetetrahydrofolate dehydrogenase (NADP+)/methenyltetrahydrofolate cyclohydrolase
MQLIDGIALAEGIYKTFPERLAKLNYAPILADIIVGDDPVALSYVRIKNRTAKKRGLDFHTEQLPATSSLEEIQQAIGKIQQRPNVAGLIVQLPLPRGINQDEALGALDPRLDVDCIGPKTNQLFYEGQAPWLPPTAGGIWEILQSLPIGFKKLQIAVIGQGELVGKPITFLLRQAGCSVITATQADSDLTAFLKDADIVISGTGKGGLITGDLLKPGAIVIDAGTSESNGGIIGDVDKESVSKVAGWLSPVPGGVGPVTVAKLLDNVLKAAELKAQQAN